MKAILVIDIPKDCWDCPLHRNSWDEENEEIMICRGTYMESHYGEKPEWCPLKPMPKRKRKIKELPQYTKEYEAYCKGEVDGWNFCLDEILGE